ncbi:MAG: 30S ribosomal protein S5, partial [Microvirga sp.]
SVAARRNLKVSTLQSRRRDAVDGDTAGAEA